MIRAHTMASYSRARRFLPTQVCERTAASSGHPRGSVLKLIPGLVRYYLQQYLYTRVLTFLQIIKQLEIYLINSYITNLIQFRELNVKIS